MLRVTRLDDAAPRIIAAAASAEFLGATIEVMDDIAPILFENEMDTFVRVRLNDTGIETPQRESILLSLDYPPEAVLNLPVVIRKEQHVSVIPPIVAFGVVKRGSAATKLLRVIGDASVDVGQLKVRGSPNVIRAAFETSNAPGEAAWKIEIGADAPPGFLNGEIVITTGEDGPVLAEVPVFALIED
jgi:hypothetical protein